MKPIVFIVPPRERMLHSGVSTFQRQLAAGFGNSADRFTIVEIPHGETESSGVSAPVPSAAGAASHSGPGALFLGLGYLKTLWRDIRRVWTVRRQIKNSVILVNEFGCETLPIALRIVFPFGQIVAISHTHPGQTAEARHWIRRGVERACYVCVLDIVFNSNASRLEWSRKLGRKSLKGTVIHLGTETPDLSSPSDGPERSAGSVDFVCVARFAGWKGQLTLVHAWEALVRRGQCEARLVFIGDGPSFDLVRTAADRAKLGSHIVFMGARPEAARYFNQADVAVLMSTEPEAFGLVLLEAMSRGLPVLASRMGGIQEIVVDRETGLLVDPANEGQLVEAIETLSSSAELRRALGDRGRMRWSAAFTAREMVRRYQEYFESMSQ